MGRASTKTNKTIYQKAREDKGLTREEAGLAVFSVTGIESITPERIEKIENDRAVIHPEEVLAFADTYNCPELCNQYCAKECPIGRQYVPEVQIKDLPQIVLEMLDSLNNIKRQQERFIEIASDGKIQDDELPDFVQIQQSLEKISITVESLQLWTEKMISAGQINRKVYQNYSQK